MYCQTYEVESFLNVFHRKQKFTSKIKFVIFDDTFFLFSNFGEIILGVKQKEIKFYTTWSLRKHKDISDTIIQHTVLNDKSLKFCILIEHDEMITNNPDLNPEFIRSINKYNEKRKIKLTKKGIWNEESHTIKLVNNKFILGNGLDINNLINALKRNYEEGQFVNVLPAFYEDED